MSDGATIPSPEEAMLGRLAELDLAAAEKVHARLMAAEEPDEIDRFGRTYHRLTRSLRQTLALKAKLSRERELHHIRTTPLGMKSHDTRQRDTRQMDPASRVRAHVHKAANATLRYLEREREPADYEPFGVIEIYEILEDLALDDDFLDTPIEDLVAAVIEIMDAMFADAGDAAPPDGSSAEDPAVQNSA